MQSMRLATGIDLPLAPSCGSMILCSDLYRHLGPAVSTTFFALPPTAPGWDHGFGSVVECQVEKAPYGADFDAYVDALTDLVGRHLGDRRPSIIHAQHLGFGLSLAFCRATGDVPVVALAHGTDVIAAQSSRQALEAMNEVVARCVMVVVPTPALGDQINTLTGHRWHTNLRVVPWGIPLDRVAALHRPAARPSLRLLHAGRLDANKSTITAVEAMAFTQAPHHLSIIGGGPELSQLRQHAADLGVADRVTFAPFAARRELWSAFADFDGFLLTTRDLEAFGLVGVEAQAHGVPVIYSAVPGLADSIGESGLHHEPGDARQLASAIDELADSLNLRLFLSETGIANARKYDVRATARHLADISHCAINENR